MTLFFLLIQTYLLNVSYAKVHPDLTQESSQIWVDRLEQVFRENFAVRPFQGHQIPSLHPFLPATTQLHFSERKCQLILTQSVPSYTDFYSRSYVDLTSNTVQISKPGPAEELTDFHLKIQSSPASQTLSFASALERDRVFRILHEMSELCKQLRQKEAQYIAKDEFKGEFSEWMRQNAPTEKMLLQTIHSVQSAQFQKNQVCVRNYPKSQSETHELPKLDYYPQIHADPKTFSLEYDLWKQKKNGSLSEKDITLLQELKNNFHKDNLESQLKIYRLLSRILIQNPDYVVFVEGKRAGDPQTMQLTADFQALQKVFAQFDPDHPTEEQEMELRHWGAATILVAQGKLKYLLPAEASWHSNSKLSDFDDRFKFEILSGRNRSVIAVKMAQETLLNHGIPRGGIIFGAAHELIPYVDSSKIKIRSVLPTPERMSEIERNIRQGYFRMQQKFALRKTTETLEETYRNLAPIYQELKENALGDTIQMLKSKIAYIEVTLEREKQMGRVDRDLIELYYSSQHELELMQAVDQSNSFETFMEIYVKSESLKRLGARWDAKRKVLVPAQ